MSFDSATPVKNGVPSKSSFSHGSQTQRHVFRSADTVRCDRCKRFFHMRCVQPPLSAKPSRGYGWTCAPCSRKHEEEVDSHEIRHVTPVAPPKTNKSNAPAPRGRGRPRKDKSQAEREENMAVKHFKMWPFRYFGYGSLFLILIRTWRLVMILW